jgi:hypothetical protein
MQPGGKLDVHNCTRVADRYRSTVPFTPCHAAAVLPFARSPLVPSALVLGSMTPDVPYFLPFLGLDSRFMHSIPGMVGIDVVVALALFLLWHVFFAPPALAAAPDPVRARIDPGIPGRALASLASLRGVAVLYASFAIGAATHVFWDSFTHYGRWGSQRIPWLMGHYGPLSGARWLQYTSGLVGGLAVLGWLVWWWRRTPPRPAWGAAEALAAPACSIAWAAIITAGLVGGIPSAVGALADPGIRPLHDVPYLLATRGTVVAVAVAALLAVAWHGQRLRGRRNTVRR